MVVTYFDLIKIGGSLHIWNSPSFLLQPLVVRPVERIILCLALHHFCVEKTNIIK